MECFTCKAEMKCIDDMCQETYRADKVQCPKCGSVALITYNPKKGYIEKVEWHRDSIDGSCE